MRSHSPKRPAITSFFFKPKSVQIAGNTVQDNDGC